MGFKSLFYGVSFGTSITTNIITSTTSTSSSMTAICISSISQNTYSSIIISRVHRCPFSIDVVTVVALCQPDYAAGNAGPGVGVFAHVVFFSVNHHGSANDGVLSKQADHLVLNVNHGGAAYGLDITKVSCVPGALVVGGPAVL